MNVPVWLEQLDGKFVASSVTHPDVRVEAATRDAVLLAVQQRLAAGPAYRELVYVTLPDQPAAGLSGLFGKYRDDPTLAAIRDEAYRLRDEEFRQEFPDDGV